MCVLCVCCVGVCVCVCCVCVLCWCVCVRVLCVCVVLVCGVCVCVSVHSGSPCSSWHPCPHWPLPRAPEERQAPSVAPDRTHWRPAGKQPHGPSSPSPTSAHDLLTWQLFPAQPEVNPDVKPGRAPCVIPWTESLGLLQVSHSWRSRC